jgi:hypothetical protein
VFDWLFEGHLSVYLALAIAAGVSLYWGVTLFRWRGRRRQSYPYLAAGGVALALMGLYFVLDRAVETDREQVVRKLNEMAAAVARRDLDAIFEPISDSYRSPQGKTKQQTRDFARVQLDSGRVREMAIWDISIRSLDRGAGRGQVLFRLKPKGPEFQMDGLCEAELDFDPAHGWRIRSTHFWGPGGLGDEIEKPF